MNYKIFWLTGLPCSGKTTLANEISKHFNAEILDGDEIRKLSNNNDFSEEGRKKHMLTVAELANMLSKYTNVIVALVSPIRSVRDEIKTKFPNVEEIYLKCSVDECISRDVKGMYKKALAGEIKNFTGINAKYEEPLYSTIIDTENLSVKESVNKLLEKYQSNKKYSLFIGRWQPLHDGHKTLFEQVRKEGKNILIGIRDTIIDESNPYSVQERIEMIKEQVPDAKITVIPDIEEIIYGRKVGYDIREIRLDENIENISATKIREESNSKEK
jgi:adenylylsulfate kinase